MSKIVKVISLIQPWASLVAYNEKRVETRSWSTKYRGEIYIHASSNIPKVAKDLCRKFADLLKIKEYNGSWLYYIEHKASALSFGHIIARANLVGCFEIKTNDELNETAYADMGNKWIAIDGNEYHFGDYTPGRYAWILQDIQILEKPIPAKGQLGIWNFNIE